MKNAILYVRVSTDEQAERGYSLRDQEERLKTYCLVKQIAVKAVFREDHSAKNFNRPEYKKLMQYARDNKRDIDMLLFTKWDRFSRNAPEAYNELAKFDKLGIIPQAMEQPLDMNIPESKIMLGLYLITPEVDNDRRSLIIKQGMRRKRREGKWDCTAPKGYVNRRDENNNPIVVPNDDAKFIKEAFEQLAKGIKPMEHIRKELVKKGFNCSRSYFATLIRNPFYMGMIRIPAFRDEKEEIVQAVHEPIVSESLFYKVQELLDGRIRKLKKPGIHRQRKELPLRGFLFCLVCNNRLTGSGSKGNGGRYFYYHCDHCKQTRFRADAVEKKLLEKLKTYSLDPEYARMCVTIMHLLYKQQEKTSQTNLISLQKQVQKLEGWIKGLQDKFADDQISSADYYAMKNRYELEMESLKLQQAENKVHAKEILHMIERGINHLINIDNQYLHALLETKQNLIGSIFTGKLYFEQNELRTTKVNKLVELVCLNKEAFKGNKKGQLDRNKQLSCMVNPEGVEPSTS